MIYKKETFENYELHKLTQREKRRDIKPRMTRIDTKERKKEI